MKEFKKLEHDQKEKRKKNISTSDWSSLVLTHSSHNW